MRGNLLVLIKSIPEGSELVKNVMERRACSSQFSSCGWLYKPMFVLIEGKRHASEESWVKRYISQREDSAVLSLGCPHSFVEIRCIIWSEHVDAVTKWWHGSQRCIHYPLPARNTPSFSSFACSSHCLPLLTTYLVPGHGCLVNTNAHPPAIVLAASLHILAVSMTTTPSCNMYQDHIDS